MRACEVSVFDTSAPVTMLGYDTVLYGLYGVQIWPMLRRKAREDDLLLRPERHGDHRRGRVRAGAARRPRRRVSQGRGGCRSWWRQICNEPVGSHGSIMYHECRSDLLKPAPNSSGKGEQGASEIGITGLSWCQGLKDLMARGLAPPFTTKWPCEDYNHAADDAGQAELSLSSPSGEHQAGLACYSRSALARTRCVLYACAAHLAQH